MLASGPPPSTTPGSLGPGSPAAVPRVEVTGSSSASGTTTLLLGRLEALGTPLPLGAAGAAGGCCVGPRGSGSVRASGSVMPQRRRLHLTSYTNNVWGKGDLEGALLWGREGERGVRCKPPSSRPLLADPPPRGGHFGLWLAVADSPPPTPCMVTCELLRVVLFCKMSAQQAAHAVHKKGRKACQELKNSPRRLSQKGL